MFAIIELGGHQYLIREKDILRVEKVATEPEKTAKTDHVHLTSDSQETKVGTPYLAGAEVEFKVLKTALGEKVRIFKMKAKKRYKRLRGHRQPFSEIEILKIKT